MPITVVCPACQKRSNAPDALAGKRAKCAGCGGVIVVPAASAQPVAQSPARPVPVVKAGAPLAVGKPVAQPHAQPAAPRVAVGKPGAPTGTPVAVGSPAAARPTAQVRPQAAVVNAAVVKPAVQSPSQAAAGSSLLDLLEQADQNGLPPPDFFGTPGVPAGHATLGRPRSRASIWTSPITIALAAAGLIVVVGGGITAALLMAPSDDTEWQQTITQSGAPSGSPSAAAQQTSDYERTAREVLGITRQLVDELVAIVDRPSAEVGIPKVIERGQRLAEVVEIARRKGFDRVRSPHDAQIDRELMPEMNQLVARIQTEMPRLQSLAVQLQMQEHFARLAEVQMGPTPAQPPPQPFAQQQTFPQQPQFIQPFARPQPQQPTEQPQPGSYHGPRHRMPRH